VMQPMVGREWAQQDSNLRASDYESAALTAELWARAVRMILLELDGWCNPC
jgi:outer membrane lipopolysaccharide assembly protein LptE/RlpB